MLGGPVLGSVNHATLETATLGGGCFWCLEAVFERLEGVAKVVSGYAGGAKDAPSYEDVCSGETGHAEVVQVTFDPAAIGYKDLLEVFFTIHDPTTLNRQGGDVGTQYRSVVFHHTPAQKAAAEAGIKTITSDALFDAPVVTEIVPLTRFWPAEEHHQGYYRRNPKQGYCSAVIAPKVAKFRENWAHRLKPSAS